MNQEMMRWQWHQLDHMQIICTSLQIENHATSLNFFVGWMLFLMPNQQHQSTKCNSSIYSTVIEKKSVITKITKK